MGCYLLAFKGSRPALLSVRHRGIYSRKIVGYEVYERECGELASQLLQRTLMREHCFNQPLVLSLRPMKSLTFKAKMDELGITSSYSRPRVIDDNPYVESSFRTVKYMPKLADKGLCKPQQQPKLG